MRKDKKLSELFKREKYTCPSDISLHIDKCLEHLCASNTGKKNFKTETFLCTVLCVIAFFILPNINANIAYAMQNIPIIGTVVKVITIREYEVNDKYHPQKVEIPEILHNGEAAEFINADIKELTDTALFRFKEACENYPNAHTGIIIDYDVITNTNDWFTLQILIHHNAGSSTTTYKYYHIDKTTGRTVTLSSLFSEDFDYINALSENIAAQMRKRNAQLGSDVYWIDKTDISTWNFNQIQAEQNFYFDDNKKLIIVFEKYQIAPGYMGNPEFSIPDEIYKHALK